VVGHEIKSRAENNTITNNRILDNSGSASYEIDLPNGGNADVLNNQVQQSAATQNPSMIHYGGESAPYVGSRLAVTGNLLQNYRSGSATGVLNATSLVVSVTGNQLYRLPTLVSGPNSQSANTTLASPVALDTSSPWAN
jgi:hypothetical protein